MIKNACSMNSDKTQHYGNVSAQRPFKRASTVMPLLLKYGLTIDKAYYAAQIGN